MLKKIAASLLAAVMVVTLASCGSPAYGQVLMSDKDRNGSPDASAAELDALVDGNSRFAFDLYQQLRTADGNFFYSPYSISLALAMAYAGAGGQTGEQMEESLSFLLSGDDLHNAFNSLDLELASRGEGAEGKDDEGFRLNIVNAIWGQKDYEFLDSFLDVLAENYGAGMRLLDFAADAEKARQTINDWVSENTEGRIEDLIPPGAVSELTRLVLTNAIYFNAAWASPFEEENTASAPFYLLNGSQVTVPMMHQTETYRYLDGDGFRAVEIPYDGNELSMVMIMPDAGAFSQFEAGLDADLAANILSGMAVKNVTLGLPQFSFEAEFGLNEALRALGMVDAFNPLLADFSGIDGKKDLFISGVIHKAFVAVDEAGTEAAAATAVIFDTTSTPEPPVELTLDNPFIFLIRDIETGSILFIGRVVDPSQ
jgi:serpin B